MSKETLINLPVNKIINCIKKINFRHEYQDIAKLESIIGYTTCSLEPKELFDRIKPSEALDNNMKADLLFSLFIKTAIPQFIYKAGALSPLYKHIAWATKTLVDQDSEWSRKTREKIEESFDGSKTEFFNNLTLSVEEACTYFSGLISSKRLSEICENESARSISTPDTMSINSDDSAGWHSSDGDIDISYKNAVLIGNFDGSKLYGYISSKFNDVRWSSTLSKGFAASAVGRNGVKFLDSKLLELKINDDARLYTQEIHKNDHGDYLAIFDRDASHEKIKRVAKEIKILTILEDCFYEKISHSEYSMSDARGAELGMLGLETSALSE